MPRKQIDYSKTIMYKIVCNDLNMKDIYVGHTTDFIKRKNSHKSKCSCETSVFYNFKVYRTIRENGHWDNWSMLEIEKFPCNDSNEAKLRERYWIENMKAKLNYQIPTRTNKEYREVKKEEIIINNKNYYSNNKEKIKEKNRDYHHNNKEIISQKHKIYTENNKQKIIEINKNYRDNNSYKITCECGSMHRKIDKSQHLKTKKHQDYLKSLEVVDV